MKRKNLSPQHTQKVNLFLMLILSVMVIYFIYWGLNYTNKNDPLLFVLAAVAGLFMAFNIGGNDVANSFGTSVGAGTLSVSQALFVAAIFEVSGAVIAGGEVTQTIRSGIVDLEPLNISTREFVCLMSSALFAAAFWLLFASKKGLPVSTTHAIIGGLVSAAVLYGLIEFGTFSGAAKPVRWEKIGTIAASWVLSPLLGCFLSYFLFRQVKKYVLDYNEEVRAKLKIIKAEKKEYKEKHKETFAALPDNEKVKIAEDLAPDAELYSEQDINPEKFKSDYYKGLYKIESKKDDIDTYRALRSWVPIISAGGGMMISAMLMFKGLKNINLELDFIINILVILMIGACIWLATFVYANTSKRKDVSKMTFLMFSWMQVFSASGFAFSHGANDIANAIGPFAAVIDAIKFDSVAETSALPAIVMLTFGIALVVGLWFIGKEVVMTVGRNIARMHPSSGFTAELSAATIVMIASICGLPVSSTHILVGAVLGIGLVNKDANWKLMRPIAMAWIITLPAASFMAAVIFFVMRFLFC